MSETVRGHGTRRTIRFRPVRVGTEHSHSRAGRFQRKRHTGKRLIVDDDNNQNLFKGAGGIQYTQKSEIRKIFQKQLIIC